jgi:hypothetical protein
MYLTLAAGLCGIGSGAANAAVPATLFKYPLGLGAPERHKLNVVISPGTVDRRGVASSTEEGLTDCPPIQGGRLLRSNISRPGPTFHPMPLCQ